MITKELSLNKIEKVYNNLYPYVVKTPFIKGSSFINELLDTNVLFKLEFLQHSGTFKARGAINNILNLDEHQKSLGITAVSAGNHAIAASYVANKFNLKNKIFIYESANKFRVNKCKSLNANLFFTNPHQAFKNVELASKNEGYYFIHPFDGAYTIQGTATLGLEICNQISDIENVIISVGGGGLISGIGSAIKQIYPSAKIIGVEPEGACGMTQSLKYSKPLNNVKINTIADSLAAPLHMPYSFSICEKIIDKIVKVSDNDMKISMKLMFENYKMVLEPACVAGIAALLGPLKNQLTKQKTVVVLCGTNIDMKTWINLAFS